VIEAAGGVASGSIASSTVIVGGPDDNAFNGAAWVYVLKNGVWTQHAKDGDT